MSDQQVAEETQIAERSEQPKTEQANPPQEPLEPLRERGHGKPPQPKRGKLAMIAVILGALIIGLLALGYLPRRARERDLASGLKHEKATLPQVSVAIVKASPANSDLLLPSNITPITEAVINARAEGYLKRRYVDIGDRVRAGQILAEVEAPELDQQVQQAQAGLSQTRAALARSEHALAQSKSNAHLSEVTAQRWKTLADRGVVSKQEFDQKQAQFESDAAAVQSAEADIRAAQDNIKASQANLARLVQLQQYEKITAPFAGIVTARNVDVGALIATSGSTPLFRIAQTNVLRVVLDVPEQSAPFIKVGEPAELTLQEFGSRKFIGHVSRTANSLDPNTRTLPTEVQVQNGDQVLMPNMFAEVRLIGVRTTPSVLIPGDAIIARPDGTQVAKVMSGNKIHFQMIEMGRDYGAHTEIKSGLKVGDKVVINPTDDVREGAQVTPVYQKEKPEPGSAGPAPAQPGDRKK